MYKKMIWITLKVAWGTIKPKFDVSGIALEITQISTMAEEKRLQLLIEAIDRRLTFNGTVHYMCDYLEEKDRFAIRAVVTKFAHQLNELMGRMSSSQSIELFEESLVGKPSGESTR